MARANGTDGSLLSSLPWTVIAVSFCALPHVPYVPVWITISFAACALGRLYIEQRRKRLPPAWLRVVLALVGFIGVLATYDNITGVGPGSALLVVMAAMKLLETRKRRDQFVLLFISIFLIMSALLREQYIWSLPFMAAALVITMTAWLRMSESRGISLRRSFGSSSRLLLLAAPLTITMWILFPRLSSPFWAVPTDGGRATTGLSNSMSPGDISSLSLSKKVAFRVDFDGDLPPRKQLYFRGLVLHHFNGRTWTGDEAGTSGQDRQRWPVEYFGEPLRYQVTMEPTAQSWVYALDVPFEWSIDGTRMARQQQLVRKRPIDQRTMYSAISYPRYRMDKNLTGNSRAYYSRLPDSSNTRTYALAEQMRGAASTNQQYINSILHMFNEQEYYYTLEPPALGSNSVDQFLFDTQQGFCEHYASAFAVLMRAAGIPSRVVLGYQGGEFNDMGEYLIVRQSDAHAWNEVWLEDRGWVRVDPTAAVAPERIDSGVSGVMFNEIGAAWGLSSPSRLFHEMTLAWDAVNAKWNEWILGYGPENQNLFMKWLGMDDPDWRQMLFTMLAIIVALILGISALLAMRYRPPPVDEAAALFRKFTRRVGIEPDLGETPYEYAARIRSEKAIGREGGVIVEQYLSARYGPADTNALQSLRHSVREFTLH